MHINTLIRLFLLILRYLHFTMRVFFFGSEKGNILLNGKILSTVKTGSAPRSVVHRSTESLFVRLLKRSVHRKCVESVVTPS